MDSRNHDYTAADMGKAHSRRHILDYLSALADIGSVLADRYLWLNEVTIPLYIIAVSMLSAWLAASMF